MVFTGRAGTVLPDCGVLDCILTTAQRGGDSTHCTGEKGQAQEALVRATPLRRFRFHQKWGCSERSRAVLGHVWRSASLLATCLHSRLGRQCHHVCPWSLPPELSVGLLGSCARQKLSAGTLLCSALASSARPVSSPQSILQHVPVPGLG